jgi:hypothetical protein
MTPILRTFNLRMDRIDCGQSAEVRATFTTTPGIVESEPTR